MSWAVTATVVTTAISASVSIYTSNAAADAQETTANYNARIQQDKARQEQEVAAENARRKEKEAQALVARQRAALAGQGLAMEGTPLAVLGETYLQEQQQVNDMAYQAATRAAALRQGAALSLVEGKNQAAGTRLQGYGQAVSSVGSATNSFLS